MPIFAPAASWKYVSTMVMKDVTTTSSKKTMARIEYTVYLLSQITNSIGRCKGHMIIEANTHTHLREAVRLVAPDTREDVIDLHVDRTERQESGHAHLAGSLPEPRQRRDRLRIVKRIFQSCMARAHTVRTIAPVTQWPHKMTGAMPTD